MKVPSNSRSPTTEAADRCSNLSRLFRSWLLVAAGSIQDGSAADVPHAKFGKRQVKSPTVHIVASGILCPLLGCGDPRDGETLDVDRCPTPVHQTRDAQAERIVREERPARLLLIDEPACAHARQPSSHQQLLLHRKREDEGERMRSVNPRDLGIDE
jgi:hypothetical protein